MATMPVARVYTLELTVRPGGKEPTEVCRSVREGAAQGLVTGGAVYRHKSSAMCGQPSDSPLTLFYHYAAMVAAWPKQ